MKKTSLTHPLQIAAISAGPALGRVGITFCPGKYDEHAMSGYCMLWFHLPIVDVSTPDKGFERHWEVAGDRLRTLLRSGRDVLVHCRGGRGRAGMIGTRLLIELGMEPETAIRRVRAVRPGAIETREQEKYVLAIGVRPQ